MTELFKIVANENDKIVFEGEDAEDIILASFYGEDRDAFLEYFDILGHKFPGDPNESYYQGMTFTSLIRRKFDGKVFGYSFWQDISKHGDYYIEPNGEDFGYETKYSDDYEETLEGPFWVWLPVEEFSVKGYKIKE